MADDAESEKAAVAGDGKPPTLSKSARKKQQEQERLVARKAAEKERQRTDVERRRREWEEALAVAPSEEARVEMVAARRKARRERRRKPATTTLLHLGPSSCRRRRPRGRGPTPVARLRDAPAPLPASNEGKNQYRRVTARHSSPPINRSTHDTATTTPQHTRAHTSAVGTARRVHRPRLPLGPTTWRDPPRHLANATAMAVARLRSAAAARLQLALAGRGERRWLGTAAAEARVARWELMGAREYYDYQRAIYGDITHKAILVDAAGTLLAPTEPMAKVYKTIGEKYGVISEVLGG